MQMTSQCFHRDLIGDHQEAMKKMQSHCMDLELELQPDNVSLSVTVGVRMVWDAKTTHSRGSTGNIASDATKLLGSCSGILLGIVKKHPGRIKKQELEASKLINQRAMKNDYKVWKYKNYLSASLFLLLAVGTVSTSIIIVL